MTTVSQIIATAQAGAEVTIDRVAGRVVRNLNILTNGPRQPQPLVSKAWRGMKAGDRDRLVSAIVINTIRDHPIDGSKAVTASLLATLRVLHDKGLD